MEHGVLPAGRVHALPGRLRVKLTDIKRAPDAARKLEERLRQEPGVAEAVANPVTGSVLVHYDPQRTSSQTILAQLAPYGTFPPSTSAPTPRFGFSSQIGREIGKELGKELVKRALVEMLPAAPVELLFALI
jgi:hypothetical protein